VNSPQLSATLLLDKYGTYLHSFANKLREENPDYILAMTRKAPRLLELFDHWGINYGGASIITEKALEFDSNLIEGERKGIIIDDIIILGSTLNWLREDHPLLRDVPVSCVIKHAKWCVDEFVRPFNWQVSLDSREAAIFCTELVQSIGYLNKPYDTDHPIFYNKPSYGIEAESLNSVSYTVYEVSSSFHYSIGKQRYTILPNESSLKEFSSAVFAKSENIPLQLCKIRLYKDNVNRQINLVPIVTFNIAAKEIQSRPNLFVDALGEYDKLILEIAGGFIKSQENLYKFYRLYSYLTSYLYGVDFCIRHSKSQWQTTSAHHSASDFIRIRDLAYLFGPAIAKELLKSLDQLLPNTVDFLDQIQNRESRQLSKNAEKQKAEPHFYADADALQKTIKPYLENNISSREYLLDKVACIFEGMFIQEELPARDRMNKSRSLRTEKRRLSNGLNYEQIRKIILDYSPQLIETDIDKSLSIAFDILVDNGVAVPFYKRVNGELQRLYRHGEDGLFQRRTGYFLSQVFHNLFSSVTQDYERNDIPKIPFEKIAVMLQKKLKQSLESPTSPMQILRTNGSAGDSTFNLRIGYCLHGAVLMEEHEAKDGKKTVEWLTRWCTSDDIKVLEFTENGYKYSNTFLNRLHAKTDEDPLDNSMVSESLIAEFSILPIVLWHLKSVADELKKQDKVKFSGDDLLVCLSTCYDLESTLDSVQKELQLLFEDDESHTKFGSGYSMGMLLNRLSYVLREQKFGSQGLWRNCQTQLQNTTIAANEIKHKNTLFTRRDTIAKEIKQAFNEMDTSIHHKIDYELELAPFVNELLSTANGSDLNGTKELNRIMALANVITNICETLKTCNSITESLVGGPRTKEGVLYQQTRDKIQRELHRVIDLSSEFRNVLISLTDIFPAREIQTIPEIHLSETMSLSRKSWLQSYKETVRIVEETWQKLSNIYNLDFSLAEWKKKKEMFQSKEASVDLLKWVLWYDIKDSRGNKRKENKEKTPKLKEMLNDEFEKAHRILKDVKFTVEIPSKDDQRFIHAAKHGSILEFLKILLNTAERFDMFVRVGIGGTPDTGQRFLQISGTDFLESEKSFAFPKRIGETLKKENIDELRRYNNNQDLKEESSDGHTMVISREAWTQIFDKQVPLVKPISLWKRVDGEKDYVIYVFDKIGRTFMSELDKKQ